MKELNDEKLCHLVACVASLYVETAGGIAIIVCKRDAMNSSSNKASPPLLLAQLCLIDMQIFSESVQNQGIRLKQKYLDASIEEIGQQFGAFWRACRGKPQFKESVLHCEHEKRE